MGYAFNPSNWAGGPEDIAGQPAKNDYEALASGLAAMVISRSAGTHYEV